MVPTAIPQPPEEDWSHYFIILLHACTLTCLQKYLDEARDFWGQPYSQQYSAEVCMPMWSHFGLLFCLSDAKGREQLALKLKKINFTV